MKDKFLKGVLVGAAVSLFVASGVYLGLLRQQQNLRDLQNDLSLSTEQIVKNAPQVVERPEIPGPENWRTYWSEEWGLGFRFPESWILEEGCGNNYQIAYSCTLSNYRLTSIRFAGDGYRISISRNVGRGLPDLNYEYPDYTVDNYTARSWQLKEGEGLSLLLVVNDFKFVIESPDVTKEISDKILSTVKFK